MHENLQDLRKIQKNISEKIILEDSFSQIRRIAGFDLAFIDEIAFVAGVVLDFPSLVVKELKIIKTKLSFPYIPTFLSFREGLPIMKVHEKFKIKPDILMINGHGIAHPLFCGIASHVGVLLDKPSIGVAQRILCGNYEKPKKAGSYSPIVYEKRIVGYAFKSKEDCNPIFISPGHKISLKSSLKIVRSCIKNHKLPEPLYLAHTFANKTKISMSSK